MQFNQAQVRDTIGISVETFRHWKRVLPPFSERKQYTLGDLLAAGVLCRLTVHCGVRAGPLEGIMTQIQGALSRKEPAVAQHRLRFPQLPVSDARARRQRA
jgi:hypothetical protein